jgi:hypothetical protein
MEKLCKLDFYEMGWMGERERERVRRKRERAIYSYGDSKTEVVANRCCRLRCLTFNKE